MTFTKTPPTKPGAYWYRPVDTAGNSGTPLVVECWLRSDGSISAPSYAIPGGEWAGPLVPVGEVEKAYREGFSDGAGCFCEYAAPEKYIDHQYINSNACKVVEGEKV